jgi:hypothetical protein
MARTNTPINGQLVATAYDVGLDADLLRTRCEAVLSEKLYWFPVRHHSPAVARQLETVIQARRPKVIFLEGPSEANDLIPYVVDAKTRPPIAIYSSYRDDDNVLGLAGLQSPAPDLPARFACWYPLLTYSPEYVAMVTAKKSGAEVLFMDLPHFALIRPAAQQDNQPTPEDGKPPADHAVEIESERLIVESGFYQHLAKVAGYRTWEEAWDSLFECREFTDAEEFRRELATFCAAARATANPQRVQADGTIERERFMLRTIRQTLKERQLKPEQAMVVCGGFHLFLDRDDPELPPEPPKGTVYNGLDLRGVAGGAHLARSVRHRNRGSFRTGRPARGCAAVDSARRRHGHHQGAAIFPAAGPRTGANDRGAHHRFLRGSGRARPREASP